MTDAVKPSEKDEGLLTSVAETIGSALGGLAAKASAAQKSLGKSTAAVVRKVTSSKRRPSRRKTAHRTVKKSRAKRGVKGARTTIKRTARRKKGRSRAK
jgi:hypothetical protein